MPGSRGQAQHTTRRTQAAEQWLWLLCARDTDLPGSHQKSFPQVVIQPPSPP